MIAEGSIAASPSEKARNQYDLAQMYLHGKNMPENPFEATRLLIQASEAGHVQSQMQLGLMYIEGRGVIQNITEANKWLRKAADQNSRTAQFRLARNYAEGMGAAADPMEAYMWCSLAAIGGEQEVITLRDQLRHILKPDQIQDAQRRAERFLTDLQNRNS
jgi:TPR repeat protein